MKTETTVSKTIKHERRRVFWRLYSLPWLISIFLLCGICVGFVYFIKDIQQTSIIKESESHQLGILEGKKLIQMEAIDNGLGEWVIDRECNIFFVWLNTNQLIRSNPIVMPLIDPYEIAIEKPILESPNV